MAEEKKETEVEILTSKFTKSVDNGVATLTYDDEKAFTENAPMPVSDMKKVFDYAHSYVEKTTNVVAEHAKDLMQNDQSIDKVIATLPYGLSKRSNVTVTANRSRTTPARGDIPEVTKSTLRVAIKDATIPISKTKIRKLEAELTATLLT